MIYSGQAVLPSIHAFTCATVRRGNVITFLISLQLDWEFRDSFTPSVTPAKSANLRCGPPSHSHDCARMTAHS